LQRLFLRYGMLPYFNDYYRSLFRNLQINNTLCHLNISNNKILSRNEQRYRCAEALGGLLANSVSLQILNFQNIGISELTFECIMTGVAQSNVISLNISHNDIDDSCMAILASKSEQNVSYLN